MNLGSAKAVTERRSIEIAVRTAHVGAMALLVGGHHFSAACSSLRPWHVLTVVTGLALLVTEASHSRHWVYQARGVITLVHAGLVALVVVTPGAARVAIAAALIVGSIGSHLPRTVRKWSLRHRRIVD
jgi:ammonia channel protein AmtB